MRKAVILAALAVILLCSVAEALDVAKGRPARGFATGSRATYRDSSSQAFDMPDAYTIYTKDGSAFWARRKFGTTWETVPVYVPANTSIVLPAPDPSTSGTNYFQIMEFTGHSDSLFVLPWVDR